MFDEKKITPFFTITIVLTPFFSLYTLPFLNGLSFFDCLLMIYLFIDISFLFKASFSNVKKIKVNFNAPMFYFFIYIIFQFFLYLGLGYFTGMERQIFIRTSRYLLYIYISIQLIPKYFDIDFGIKVLRWYVVFSTVYIFVQILLLRTTGFYLYGFIPFIPLTRPELLEFSQKAWNSPEIRVRSIFGEISQYALVTSVYLYLSLFNSKYKDKVSLIIFVSFGLLISKSTMSLLVLFLTLGIYIFLFFLSKGNKRLKYSLIVIIMFFLFVYSRSTVYSSVKKRLLWSLSGRFSGYKKYLFLMQSKTLLNFLFGIGMDSSLFDTWMPSLLRILVYFGFLGFILLFNGLYKVKDYRLVGLVPVFFVFILGSVSEILIGEFLLLFYAFLFPGEDDAQNLFRLG